MSYDKASVLESANRFQSSQELVDWLPQLKSNGTRNLAALEEQFELANVLLVKLKDALESQ